MRRGKFAWIAVRDVISVWLEMGTRYVEDVTLDYSYKTEYAHATQVKKYYLFRLLCDIDQLRSDMHFMFSIMQNLFYIFNSLPNMLFPAKSHHIKQLKYILIKSKDTSTCVCNPSNYIESHSSLVCQKVNLSLCDMGY
jgi:hypothetical protein